jgi:hypothetical protein
MEQNVINEEHYKLKVRKNWVKTTEQWHILLTSEHAIECKFEMFLTDFELQKFKDAL